MKDSQAEAVHIKVRKFWHRDENDAVQYSPLTTSAESYSDSPEIFTSDSSYVLKNKMFLHEFFSSSSYQEM